MNSKLRLFGTLIAPTLSSVLVTGCLVAISSTAVFIKYGSNGFYSLLLGPDSSSDLINVTQEAFSAFYQTVFGNSTLNKVLFFVFWMLIGLVVYLLISLVGKSIEEADETIHEMNYVHTQKTQFLEQLGVRVGVRLAVMLCAYLYSVVFMKVLFPFSLANFRIAAGALPGLSGFGHGVLGVLIFGLSFHVYVILARLFLIRLRVFESE